MRRIGSKSIIDEQTITGVLTVRFWLSWGMWALLDQALFAVSGFLFGLILARELAPNNFGVFTIAFSIFLFAAGFYNALILEPMLALGPGKYSQAKSTYVSRLKWLHWLISAKCGLLMVVVAIVAYMLRSIELGNAILALGLAAPFILFSWFVRRSAYILSKPWIAIFVSAGHLVILTGGLSMLAELGLLTEWVAIGLLGVSGLMASIWPFLRQQRSSPSTPLGTRHILRDHWKYGQWVIYHSVASWVSTMLPLVVLGATQEVSASGALNAALLLIRPAQIVIPAVMTILVPVFVRDSANPEVVTFLGRAILVGLILGIAYWGSIGVFGDELMFLLYNGKYTCEAYLLWYVGAVIPLQVLSAMSFVFLRATLRPDLEFKSALAACGGMIFFGVPLTLAFKLDGAALSIVLAAMVTAAVGARHAYRMSGRTKRISAE